MAGTSPAMTELLNVLLPYLTNETGPANIAGPASAYRYPTTRQILVMSTSLVSGSRISATMKLIAATTIGYQSPE